MENIDKEAHRKFENKLIETIVLPEMNNYKHLKLVLKTLAERQANILASDKPTPAISGHSFKEEAQYVASLDFFKNLSEAYVKKEIEKLEKSVNELLSDNILVKNVGCFSTNNIFVEENTSECVLLDIPTINLRPPVHDALIFIFAHSNEKFRQVYFEEMINFYFEALVRSLENLNCEIASKINRIYIEKQVRILLPVVKFKLIYCLSNLKETLEKQTQLEEILLNVYDFLKYPLINREDCYEVTKNKFESTDYELLSYELTPLNEKNGHLGEYFHFNMKVNFESEIHELELFAKFLIPPIDTMRSVIENGPAKKEDFCYRILFPMFAKYGLGSLLDFAPRCYLSRINWVLVLDDLGRQGFISLKPNAVLNYDGLRTVVSQLAKFHSCTMILEEILSQREGKRVRIYDDYAEFFQECVLVYEEGNALKKLFDVGKDSIHYLVEKCPELTSKLKLSELERKVDEAYMSVFKKVLKSDTLRNCICHGDMHVSNVLISFDENNTALKACLIDFQILRYCPSTQDLLFFLYLNAETDTRKAHLKQLTEEYYEEVVSYLEQFKLDPKIVFPKEEYERSLKYMKSVAIIQALRYAQIIRIEPEFRKEIFHDQKKFNYYLKDNRRQFIDLVWKSESYKSTLKGYVQDLLHMIKNEEL